MPSLKTRRRPKDDRLRQWYIDMLVDCQKRGIVGLVTNMYDLYFANEKNDASVVPYMDGDYFPAQVENIIKDIEEGKVGKKGSKARKKKKNVSTQQQKKSRKICIDLPISHRSCYKWYHATWDGAEES
jgi:E1A/CREB-binding protein